MKEVDKECPMIRTGVSGFLLVPAYPGSPGTANQEQLGLTVKQLCDYPKTTSIY